MIAFLRRFWDSFLNNEAYFIARVRALVGLVAGLTAAEASSIAGLLHAPGLEPWLVRAGVVGAALALLMRAGDKTPENVKELAKEVKP